MDSGAVYDSSSSKFFYVDPHHPLPSDVLPTSAVVIHLLHASMRIDIISCMSLQNNVLNTNITARKSLMFFRLMSPAYCRCDHTYLYLDSNDCTPLVLIELPPFLYEHLAPPCLHAVINAIKTLIDSSMPNYFRDRPYLMPNLSGHHPNLLCHDSSDCTPLDISELPSPLLLRDSPTCVHVVFNASKTLIDTKLTTSARQFFLLLYHTFLRCTPLVLPFLPAFRNVTDSNFPLSSVVFQQPIEHVPGQRFRLQHILPSSYGLTTPWLSSCACNVLTPFLTAGGLNPSFHPAFCDDCKSSTFFAPTVYLFHAPSTVPTSSVYSSAAVNDPSASSSTGRTSVFIQNNVTIPPPASTSRFLGHTDSSSPVPPKDRSANQSSRFVLLRPSPFDFIRGENSKQAFTFVTNFKLPPRLGSDFWLDATNTNYSATVTCDDVASNFLLDSDVSKVICQISDMAKTVLTFDSLPIVLLHAVNRYLVAKNYIGTPSTLVNNLYVTARDLQFGDSAGHIRISEPIVKLTAALHSVDARGSSSPFTSSSLYSSTPWNVLVLHSTLCGTSCSSSP